MTDTIAVFNPSNEEQIAELEAQDNGMNATAARHIIPVSVDMLKY